MVTLCHSQRESSCGQTGEAVENGLVLLLEAGPLGEDLAQVPAQTEQVETVGMPDHPGEPFPIRMQIRNRQDSRKHAVD